LGVSKTLLEVAMLKTILAATTAVVLAGSALAYADAGHRDHGMRHWRASAADISAYGDARIAALHAGLQLSAEQEKNWPAVEVAMKDRTKLRSDRAAARANADKPKDPIERLAARGEAQAERGAALKKFADAAEPLYKSLNPEQKHRFMVLARVNRHANHWRHAWRGHRGAWDHHHPRDGAGQPRGGQAPQPQ
jgi:hypothetical protein